MLSPSTFHQANICVKQRQMDYRANDYAGIYNKENVQ